MYNDMQRSPEQGGGLCRASGVPRRQQRCRVLGSLDEIISQRRRLQQQAAGGQARREGASNWFTSADRCGPATLTSRQSPIHA
jgi:hypothetical protein